MFVGHLALAFGAKRMAPAVSLGTLFLACQFADLLWPTLVLLGVETVEIDPGNTVLTPLRFVRYPYSHSLMALVGWSALFALIYRALRGSRRTAIATVGLLVVSHWVLDALTHRPDMPLTIGGSARIGLGLWNAPAAAITIELLLLGIGLALYVRSTEAHTGSGRLGLWALVAFLLVAYLAALFGPPPPSATAVAWSAQAMWLLVVWGYWIDRQRQPR